MTTRSLLVVVLGVLMFSTAPVGPSVSAATPPATADPCGRKKCEPKGDASDSDFDITVTSPRDVVPVSGQDDPRPESGGGTAAVPLYVTDTTHEPTCSSNRPENGGALCGMATGTCPNEGDVAYWVYRRTRNTQTGAVTPWVRVHQPPFVCLGPTDPAAVVVPVEVLIGQELAREFASLPLPRGQVDVRPQGQTLVGVETRFFTATSTQPLPPLTLLNRRVVVTAVAQRYDWYMADGSPGTVYKDAGAGSVDAPIRHAYRQPGPVGQYVRITWGGTFTVEGIAGSFPINGTASTDGPPADLTVRSARSELVRD